MHIPFTKVEAIGNNFVLINALDLGEMDWPGLARQMSAHHFGVGSDGLLVLSDSAAADFRFRMFNPDGTEDVCGNGMRCAAVYVHAKGLTARRAITLEAKSGIVGAEVVRDGDGKPAARMNMGIPSMRPEDIPVNVDLDRVVDYPIDVGGRTCRVTCVLVGTPHAVIFADRDSFWERIPPLSAELEVHPLFPERTSVTWCFVESRDTLVIRTWERGVGATLGCGTGACAALVAANVSGLAGSRASVKSPGGTLDVEWPGSQEIFAAGPANIVFEGEWLMNSEADVPDGA